MNELVKHCNWFLTINENAECYNNIQELLDMTPCDYAYIYHINEKEDDGDLDKFIKNQENIEIGNFHQHIHVVIKYKNQTTYQAVFNRFKGAHIEYCKSLRLSLRYLVHLDNSDKRQYDIREVIQRNDLFNRYYDEELIFTFDSLKSLIENKQIKSFNDCLRIYGANSCNRYIRIIEAVFISYNFKGSCIGNYKLDDDIMDIYLKSNDIIAQNYEKIDKLELKIKEMELYLSKNGFL